MMAMEEEAEQLRKSREAIRQRYDRIASLYDYLEAPLEWASIASWRVRLGKRVIGKHILEVGVGTGRNLPYYPQDVELTAIDISPRMLDQARERAARLGRAVKLLEMDVEQMIFPDQSFDTVCGTLVFCSVADPVKGLRELRRVCQPQGKLLLLEHMRPTNAVLGSLFDFLNPLTVWAFSESINRRTVEDVRKAGWRVVEENQFAAGIFRWIEAAL